MLVVIDTNVLVSALLSRQGNPAKVMAFLLKGSIIPCYDFQIIHEYELVLRRPRFGFEKWEIDDLLDYIESIGISVVADPVHLDFADPDDAKFYEVAKYCQATLITGNIRHFPDDPCVMSVNDFLDLFKER